MLVVDDDGDDDGDALLLFPSWSRNDSSPIFKWCESSNLFDLVSLSTSDVFFFFFFLLPSGCLCLFHLQTGRTTTKRATLSVNPMP
jgi:hypothetical protein